MYYRTRSRNLSRRLAASRQLPTSGPIGSASAVASLGGSSGFVSGEPAVAAELPLHERAVRRLRLLPLAAAFDAWVSALAGIRRSQSTAVIIAAPRPADTSPAAAGVPQVSGNGATPHLAPAGLSSESPRQTPTTGSDWDA